MASFTPRLAIVSCSLLSLSTFAFGEKASIEADVKGADGRAPKNAQVQIDSLDKKAKAIVVKPNASGHVTASKLDAGSYRVSVIVDGKVQSSQTVKVEANKPVAVTLKVATASRPVVPAGAKTKVVNHKIYVWVPPTIGSRFGGYWKEAGSADVLSDGNGNTTNVSGDGMDNVQRQGRASTRSTSGVH